MATISYETPYYELKDERSGYIIGLFMSLKAVVSYCKFYKIAYAIVI